MRMLLRSAFFWIALAGILFGIASLAVLGRSSDWIMPTDLGAYQSWQAVELIPQKESRPIIDAAKLARDREYSAARRWATWATVFQWLSFAMASAITLAAGWHGMVVKPENSPEAIEQVQRGKSARFARSVGLLAALSMVSTGASDRLGVASRNAFVEGERINKELSGLLLDFSKASDETTARRILGDIELVAKR